MRKLKCPNCEEIIGFEGNVKKIKCPVCKKKMHVFVAERYFEGSVPKDDRDGIVPKHNISIKKRKISAGIIIVGVAVIGICTATVFAYTLPELLALVEQKKQRKLQKGAETETVSSGESTGHVHSFGDLTVRVNPKCETDGISERYCECGEKEAVTVPALGHSFFEGVCTVCGIKEPDSKTKP